MLQNIIILYFIFLIVLFFSFTKINYLQKFFFYSEIIWLILFLILLNLEIISNTLNLLTNCFFILVFTAIEALILASIILLLFKKPL